MICSDCLSANVPVFPTPDNKKEVCSKCYKQHVEGKVEVCEVCPNSVASWTIHTIGRMKMCCSCYSNEMKLQAENNTPEKQQQRVDTANEVMQNSLELNALATSRQIDSSITVRTDLFNAATTSIIDLKKIIDDSPEIQNKQYALAEELMRRFEHFKDVIFEANQTVVEASNNQRAIQVYLNQLSNQLRAEEREKLKIQDIDYKPREVKVSKPKAIRTKKVAFNKVDIRNAAAALTQELGKPIPEYMLQMIVTSRQVTVEEAANILRKSLKEGISESTPDNLPAEDMTGSDISDEISEE